MFWRSTLRTNNVKTACFFMQRQINKLEVVRIYVSYQNARVYQGSFPWHNLNYLPQHILGWLITSPYCKHVLILLAQVECFRGRWWVNPLCVKGSETHSGSKCPLQFVRTRHGYEAATHEAKAEALAMLEAERKWASVASVVGRFWVGTKSLAWKPTTQTTAPCHLTKADELRVRPLCRLSTGASVNI